MHLDTMEAQTASLQASAGGGLRVMMMRMVGVSRRSKGEARLHLEKKKVVKEIIGGIDLAHLMLWRVPAQL